MTSAENLADLFQFAGKFGGKGSPNVDTPFGFHQGLLVAWDPVTGRNTVRVLGTEVHDLPMLSMADSILLSQGDSVAVLRFRQTYFILGRIIPPETPTRRVFYPAGDSTTGFSIPFGVFTEIIGYDYVMPDWASNVVIMASVNGAVRNTSGGLDNLNHLIEIGGTQGFSVVQAVEDTYWQGLTNSFTVGGQIDPGTRFRVSVQVAATTRDWPADFENKAYLTSTAIFGNT